MKIAITLVCTMVVLSSIILIPNVFAENVPDWVKNTAGWWAEDFPFYSLSINSLACGGSGLNPFRFLISCNNVAPIDFGTGVHALK